LDKTQTTKTFKEISFNKTNSEDDKKKEALNSFVEKKKIEFEKI
jgi:hypothetical protein